VIRVEELDLYVEELEDIEAAAEDIEINMTCCCCCC